MPNQDPFDQIVAALYVAPLRPEMWTVALGRLANAMDIRQAAVFDHGPETHRIFAFVGDPIREGGHLYERHYWRYDEWTKRLPKHPTSDGLVHGEAIWPEAMVRKSLFFNEFLLKYDVCQFVGVVSYAPASEFNVLSVYREPDGPALEHHQYRSLRLLAPHLNTAFALRRRLTELDSRISDLESALNRVNIALILLDRRGKPLLVNAAAQQICNRRDGLLLGSSGLTTARAGESATLQALIDRTVSGVASKGPIQGGAAVVSKKNGGPLHLLVSPIPRGLVDIRGRAIAMLLIVDPDRDRTLPEDILRQLFSLTSAESRLALLLLAGLTLPETADRLGVSRETVRSQIKSVLQKTGTKRQGELIMQLAEFRNLGQ